MPTQAGGPAYAGISLQAGRMHAVVLRDHRVVSIPFLPAGHGDVEELLSRILEVTGRSLKAVTLDISRILHEAVQPGAQALPPVAVVRIVPQPASDPALARSPADLVERLIAHRFTVAGGHDLLGHELCPLDLPGVETVTARLTHVGIRDIAIVAAGSQANPVHEQAVANIIQAAVPRARISVASDFGGHGLIAREATVTLDCALGPLTDRLLVRWERALAAAAPHVVLRVARGDGGHSTSSRIRSLPVVAMGAHDALQISGAAHLERTENCRVLLPRPGGQVAGDVRKGLVAIRSGELEGFGVELVVPTAVLTPDRGGSAGDELGRSTDGTVVLATRDPLELACLGAAVSQPTSWLDEFAYIESADELEKVRGQAQERARAIVVANGAAPGSTYVAEVSTVAVPYSPPGTVRIRVRVAGAADTDPRRIEVFDRMAP